MLGVKKKNRKKKIEVAKTMDVKMNVWGVWLLAGKTGFGVRDCFGNYIVSWKNERERE